MAASAPVVTDDGDKMADSQVRDAGKWESSAANAPCGVKLDAANRCQTDDIGERHDRRPPASDRMPLNEAAAEDTDCPGYGDCFGRRVGRDGRGRFATDCNEG